MTENTLSPETLARLDDARRRLADCDRFRAQLDLAFEKLAQLNVAVSATPAGDAWHAVDVRARICRKSAVREIDALLDGDEAEANLARGLEETMREVVALYVEKLVEASEGVLRVQ